MRLPSVPALPVVDHLNTTYFHRVWNAPEDHGRANFPLPKAAKSVQIGTVPVNLSVVGLPTTDTVYAVYRLPPYVFGRYVNLTPNTWVTDNDITHSDFVSILAYDQAGRKIPAGHIHLRYDVLRAMVLVAIERVYTAACTGRSYPDLYITVERDTERTTRIVSQVKKVHTNPILGTSPQAVKDVITAAKLQYPVGTVVYVNGWLYDPSYVPELTINDIVEITCDPDIVAYCDIDVDDNQTGYYSNEFGEYREIIHIPRSLNPDNYVITHDSLSIGIFDKATRKGVYGHRLDPHAIESITHNDFSMSRKTLEAFQDSMSSQGLTVRLYIRFAQEHQINDGDVNRIKDLYSLSDGEILKQLAGLSQLQIAEWKAAHLEQSTYIDLLYKFDGFDTTTAIRKFSDAMGYYDVAATLSQAMHYYTYKGSEVRINKPARLIGQPCRAIVYADGRKVPEASVDLRECGSGFVILGFEEGSHVSLDTRIGVYLVEGGVNTVKTFNPTVQNPSITVDSDDYAMVKIITYSEPKKVMDGTVTKGYHIYPPSPADYRTVVNANGSVTYTVSGTHYGESFYLVPYCGLDTIAYPIDDFIANHQPIILPLYTSDNQGGFIPQIGHKTFEVYLNGYRLIEGLDYTCDPIKGDYGDVLQMVLVVSNSDYLDFVNDGNVLELLIHGDQVASVDKGYVVANKLHRTMPPMVWDASCGRAFAHGRLIQDVREVGTTLISDEDIDNGSPYLLEWNLPYGVAKLMATIPTSSDIDLRTRVLGILKLTPPEYPSLVRVSHLYALYSPYLAKIVADVASGTLVLIDEPKDDAFLRQLSAYAVLRYRDPVLGSSNPLIDIRFVTIAAHYVNLTVLDPTQMFMVQRLISLVLASSELSINEVLV
jgi:hypothetical protein